MEPFQLKIWDKGAADAKIIELNDGDASSALQTLWWRNRDQQAELWKAGKLICKVEQAGVGADLWYVAPAGPA